MKFYAFIVAIVVALLSSSSPVVAQTHVCDQQAPSAQTIASGAPHKAAFCSPSTEKLEAAIAWVDGQAVDLLPITPVGAPSATSGLQLYETNLFIQVARGMHVLEMSTYNRNAISGQLQLGGKSAPFSFAAVDDTPKTVAPVIKGVSR